MRSNRGRAFHPGAWPSDERRSEAKPDNRIQTGRGGHWLRNVEAEVSLDYVVTGLPQAGDIVGDERFVDRASPWSASFVLVFPDGS